MSDERADSGPDERRDARPTAEAAGAGGGVGGRPPFDIVRVGHVELRVTDLDRARAFYVDLLGFVETERTQEVLYLRGLEERFHHSLALRRAESPGLGHIAFRVRSADDLARAEAFFRRLGRPVRWVEAGAEAGQGRALRAQDPFGFPVEFFCEIDEAERLLQRFDAYRGAFPMRIDHVNLFVPDVQAAHDWYTAELGFRCSEYTETAGAQPRVWASWLFRKPNVHDVALMNGAGPRLHHVGFWVADTASVLRACDILAAAGRVAALERGPGRHGISNAFFLYLRDPDGNRIELYTGDYLTADPDFRPIRWSLDDPRRQTFWGHAAPPSWFEEASPVEDVRDGSFVPLSEPLLQDRPHTVT
ncbi:MAG: 3,4-dihydroxyphenylacetate 2,3-dioxygenase [Clostridia bacterium]|nr:3,4-dihydroxyphenylacetate 2,3-dioxygenase [Clostridia bacterium]